VGSTSSARLRPATTFSPFLFRSRRFSELPGNHLKVPPVRLLPQHGDAPSAAQRLPACASGPGSSLRPSISSCRAVNPRITTPAPVAPAPVRFPLASSAVSALVLEPSRLPEWLRSSSTALVWQAQRCGPAMYPVPVAPRASAPEPVLFTAAAKSSLPAAHIHALEGDKPSSLSLDRRGDVPRIWHCRVPAWRDSQWKHRSAGQ